MAYSAAVRESYRRELAGMKEAGLFKEERYIHAPQAAEIEVEFPAGASLRPVINLCSTIGATGCPPCGSSAGPRTSIASWRPG